MYCKIQFTSTELKRLILKGGLCSRQTNISLQFNQGMSVKIKTFDCFTDPDRVTEKQLLAVFETLFDVVERSFCMTGISKRFTSSMLKGSLNLKLLTDLTLLTYVGLMDGFHYRQKSRCLLTFEFVLSAKKQNLHVQLEQHCSFWLGEVNT